MASMSKLQLQLWTLVRPSLFHMSTRSTGNYAANHVHRFSARSNNRLILNSNLATVPRISTSDRLGATALFVQSRTSSGRANLDTQTHNTPQSFFISLSDTTGSRYNYGSHESNAEFRNLGWMSLFVIGAVVGANVLMSWDSPVEAAMFGQKDKPSTDATKMFLYWVSGSPPCWRVMLALEEKGLQNYPNRLLSMEQKEHKTEEVLHLNPRGQVPTFTHEGNVINESVAVVDYLEASFKDQGTSLLPCDQKKLSVVLQKKYEALLLFTKGIEGHFFYSFKKPEDKTQGEINSRLKAFRDELDSWESHFRQMGACHYAGGKDFSMADVMLFPTLALMWQLGLDLDKYPSIKAYFDRTKQRPSIQKTWPPHWKGSPRRKYLENV